MYSYSTTNTDQRGSERYSPGWLLPLKSISFTVLYHKWFRRTLQYYMSSFLRFCLLSAQWIHLCSESYLGKPSVLVNNTYGLDHNGLMPPEELLKGWCVQLVSLFLERMSRLE